MYGIFQNMPHINVSILHAPSLLRGFHRRKGIQVYASSIFEYILVHEKDLVLLILLALALCSGKADKKECFLCLPQIP